MRKVVRKRARDEHIYYDDGKFSVTDRNLKTPRKTYRIASLEKIGLRRDPVYFALALSLPMLGLLYAFNNFLYDYERIALVAIPAFLLLVTSRLGILFVESKALAEMAAMASIGRLRAVREAVEAAIDDFHHGPDDDDDPA